MHTHTRARRPNTITLIGLLFQVAAYVVLATESASFSEPVAPWKAAFAAFCLFTYATLDNMDGKQARKIGASSPLGLLFDHGCDAINTGMLGSLIFAMVIRAEADSWQMYVIWSFACTGFFMNTWEECVRAGGGAWTPTVTHPHTHINTHHDRAGSTSASSFCPL